MQHMTWGTEEGTEGVLPLRGESPLSSPQQVAGSGGPTGEWTRLPRQTGVPVQHSRSLPSASLPSAFPQSPPHPGAAKAPLTSLSRSLGTTAGGSCSDVGQQKETDSQRLFFSCSCRI